MGVVVTSPNHGLNNGDYIVINGVLGTIGAAVNGLIFAVTGITVADLNHFIIVTGGPISGTYLGNGTITRMYVPFIQTMQFPIAWAVARKTRIGPMFFLFTNSNTGQVELQIYLSMNADSAYNAGTIVPASNVQNNSLIYTDILSTGFEGEAITIFNPQSFGIIGDGIARSFPLFFPSFPLVPGSVSITVDGIATFQDNGQGGFNVTGTGMVPFSTINYSTGEVIISFSVAPISQPVSATWQFSQNIQSPTAAQQSQIWHRLSTSLIGDTVQIGITLTAAQMADPLFRYQFAEIEFHGMICDVNQSQMLI
jgi:hypothetical protein